MTLYDHDGEYDSLVASNISSLVQMRKMIVIGKVEEGYSECCDGDESNIALILIVRIAFSKYFFHLHQNFSMV